MKTNIEMAREAGMFFAESFGAQRIIDGWLVDIERFAELVRADERDRAMRENAYVLAEREACAKVCEEQEYHYWRATEDQDFTPQDCANAIRARENT